MPFDPKLIKYRSESDRRRFSDADKEFFRLLSEGALFYAHIRTQFLTLERPLRDVEVHVFEYHHMPLEALLQAAGYEIINQQLRPNWLQRLGIWLLKRQGQKIFIAHRMPVSELNYFLFKEFRRYYGGLQQMEPPPTTLR